MQQALDTRVVAIGKQDFEDMISHNNFYIDKTGFIKEWWENDDFVTLITRPRRFGKTLLMNTVETFFSINCKEKAWLFKGMKIFEEEKYQKLQGTYPVIFITFATIKGKDYSMFYQKIRNIIAELYRKNLYLLDSDKLNEFEKKTFMEIQEEKASEMTLSVSLKTLSDYFLRYYGKKPIILLDEYDTPMQEAYLYGYWDEIVTFTRNLFNETFKTNPYLGRAILTGITRVSKESIFSDLNHLEVVTTTSGKYKDSFGFTEQEVFCALDQKGMEDWKEDVKYWYDGFTFGGLRDIYNPWSVINFIDKKKFYPYWANTSSNGLLNHILQPAGEYIKEQLELLMHGQAITVEIDEQIVFNQLDNNQDAIWSLMLASGYLKVEDVDFTEQVYKLTLTNYEVKRMMRSLIRGWFQGNDYYNKFLKALLVGDLDAMNVYMNRVSMRTFSFFDSGKQPSEEAEPERFYHGFVLGLIAELEGKYQVRSNRESGFGRYDVMLEPMKLNDMAYIFEFKVRNPIKEKTLEETADAGLKQIQEKRYEEELIARNIPAEKIKKYAFAFEGKKILIKEKQ